MSRGYGATFGAGTTDVVLSPALTDTTLYTLAIWTYRHGEGGGNIGRMLDKVAAPALLNRLAFTRYEFSAGWTTAPQQAATWQFARPAADEWHHICLTYDTTSTAAPIVYVDGVAVSVTTLAAASGVYIQSPDAWSIGNRAAADRNWDGMLAEFAWWNRILSATEVAALGAKQYSPLWYARGLVMYLPMVRSLHNYCGTASTVTGTAVTTHPPVIYPRTRFYSFSPVVVGVGDTPGVGSLTLLRCRMILNLVELNAATTTTWKTGDVNGPSMRWVDAPAVSGTWTKATEPAGTVTTITVASGFIVLLAIPNEGGGASTTTTIGNWHKETV